jgi:hypothetical protein
MGADYKDFVIQGHLGGYFAGGDPDTLYPEMWEWLVESERITSVLDVGCGDGTAMDAFAALGCEVAGIDGVEQENPLITIHDFTAGPLEQKWRVDLVWSCEFVEHVEPVYIHNFMPVMTCAPLVLMTHAVPGQSGHHHVNCKPSTYWRRVFRMYGYEVDQELTVQTRSRAHGYYADTGMAFRKV